MSFHGSLTSFGSLTDDNYEERSVFYVAFIQFSSTVFCPVLWCGARAESRGAKNKLPPEAGTKIANCDSGSFEQILKEKK